MTRAVEKQLFPTKAGSRKMNTKILCMSVIAFSLATGAAMASSAKGTSA